MVSVLLNIVVSCGVLAIPALSAGLINYGIMRDDISVSLDIGVLMLIAALIAGACQVINAAIAVWASEYCAHSIRQKLFEKIQILSFGNIDRFRSSDLLVRLTTDVQNVKTAVQQSLMNLMQVPLLLVGTIIITAVMAPELVWIMIVLLVLLTIILVMYFVIVKPAFTKKQARIDEMNKALRETLTGIRVVKSFVRQQYEIDRFRDAASELRIASLRPQYVMSYLMPTVFAISLLGFGAVYFFGGTGVVTGSGLMIGNVTSAAQYILVLMMPLLIIAIVLPFITQAAASLARIYEVLDALPEVQEPANPVQFAHQDIRGEVTFDHVSFAYRNASGDPEGEVLSGITFTARPGETIGILGATGSGKTSLVSLIPRFYDVTGGSVMIDGIDVRSIPLATLRRVAGFCLQEPVLFSGTIRDSVRFAQPELTDDGVVEAAKAADVDTFVQNIPQQYDGMVSRRGANFSGGQRQRLAIARVLAQKPKILILDDSTSACDVATEARIQDAISEIMQGVTRFIVAQRISSVITADRILLLEQGRIVSQGNHEYLLKTSPLYQEIYKSQLGGGIRPGEGEA